MASWNKHTPELDRSPGSILHPPASPRFPPGTPTSGANRKIAIAVDLSDESAFAVKWAVQDYLRPGDAVILLNVRPTSVLYGADWGSIDHSVNTTDEKSDTSQPTNGPKAQQNREAPEQTEHNPNRNLAQRPSSSPSSSIEPTTQREEKKLDTRRSNRTKEPPRRFSDYMVE